MQLVSKSFLFLILLSMFSSVAFGQINKVLYGRDGRKEVASSSNPIITNIALSVAMLVDKHILSKSDNNPDNKNYSLRIKKTFQDYDNLCDSERFKDQIAPGFCSSFLIADDIIVTAGHCFKDIDCKDTAVLFDYKLNEASQTPIKFSSNELYFCKEQMYKSNLIDLAVFKLDRKTIGRQPIKIDLPAFLQSVYSRKGFFGRKYKVEQVVTFVDYFLEKPAVYTIGHPMGLPMKLTKGGFIREFNDEFFKTNLDTYQGSSGSPIFDKRTNSLIGMLVNGEEDLVRTDEGCMVSKKCEESECLGEAAISAEEIQFALSKILE